MLTTPSLRALSHQELSLYVEVIQALHNSYTLRTIIRAMSMVRAELKLPHPSMEQIEQAFRQVQKKTAPNIARRLILGRTEVPVLNHEEELALVLPVAEQLSAELGVTDTTTNVEARQFLDVVVDAGREVTGPVAGDYTNDYLGYEHKIARMIELCRERHCSPSDMLGRPDLQDELLRRIWSPSGYRDFSQKLADTFFDPFLIIPAALSDEKRLSGGEVRRVRNAIRRARVQFLDEELRTMRRVWARG